MIYAENILLCIAIPLAISLLFVRGEVRRYVAAVWNGRQSFLHKNHALSLCKTLNLKKFQKKVSKIPKKCD